MKIVIPVPPVVLYKSRALTFECMYDVIVFIVVVVVDCGVGEVFSVLAGQSGRSDRLLR